MQAKKILISAAALSFVGSIALAPGAFADPISYETGNHDDISDPSGGDNTLFTDGETVTVNGEMNEAGDGGGLGVRVEGLGKAAIGGDAGNGGTVYAEDGTDGDQIAGVIAAANEASGCQFIAPEDGAACGDDTGADTAAVTVNPAG